MAKGEDARRQLLERTRDFILEHGLVDVSLSELARAIGSNNRMLLYHFGSLHDLLTEAVDEALGGDALSSELAELLRSDAPLAERLEATWARIAAMEFRPQLRVFFARFGMGTEAPDRHRQFLLQTREAWVAMVQSVLADEGIPDAHDRAVAIVSLWRGLQIALLSGESPETLERVQSAAAAAMLTTWTAR
jgi:AcrR family transcriptional regulator